MNFYIAARFNKRGKVNKIKKFIEQNGHKVISTWPEQNIIKPYDNNSKLSQKYAKLCLNEIKKSDVFILISDKEGTGMYFELGFAYHSHFKISRPKIYIVGKYLSRSMFYFLPEIKLFPDIKSVVEDLRG